MVECLLHAQSGAGSPSAHPCSPCTGEGERPRESQALAELEHRTEAKGQCFQEPFCTDGHLCLTSELGFFLPMARGFRKRPRLMKARDSDYCCLRLFAFPGELFRLPLVWDPSAVPSGLLAGLTSTCL